VWGGGGSGGGAGGLGGRGGGVGGGWGVGGLGGGVLGVVVCGVGGCGGAFGVGVVGGGGVGGGGGGGGGETNNPLKKKQPHKQQPSRPFIFLPFPDDRFWLVHRRRFVCSICPSLLPTFFWVSLLICCPLAACFFATPFTPLYYLA